MHRLLTIMVAILYSLVIQESNGAIKTWMPSTNYWDVKNWDVKRIPCRNDRVIFPQDSAAAVALHPGATNLREMVLPLTGEVLLASNGDLNVVGQQDNLGGCEGEEVEFTGGETRYWLDPANWNGPSGEPLKGGENSPIPHSERVPCETDQVVLMNGGLFQIQLPEVPIKVGELNIEGQDVSQERLRNMILDDTGYHVFKGDASQLEITHELCQDPKGCICNADLDPLTLERICSFEKMRCTTAPCEDPITPKGFCCPICGAAIRVLFKGSWSRMKQMIESMVEYNQKQGEYPVLYHISRIDKNELQIVLRDSQTYVSSSVVLAQALQEQFETVSFESTPYAKATYSGDPITSWGSAGSIVFKILFISAIFVVTALTVNCVANQSGRGIPVELIQPSFLFARFENTAADGEVEIAQKSSFQNPLFSLVGQDSTRSLEKVTLRELEELDNLSDEMSSQTTDGTFSLEE
ncbi:protein amnionless [Cloeon dipterum]|uniref:protein amnionless n=1 Tax=Cloeon dipterum TaxID=197152 RepID=UPI00321FCB0B